MSFKTKRVQAPTQNLQIQVPDSSSPLSIRLIMKQVLSEYSRRGRGQQSFIQFWQCSSPQGSKANGFNVTTKGQPFFPIPEPNSYLDRYRKSCVDKACSFVGQNTKVGKWLVGRAIQKRLADQGTIHADGSHDQKLGLFVMPVFFVRGTRKQTVGVIELVTIVPKPSYGEEFEIIRNLLKEQDIGENERLESGEMGKTIKVEYKEMGNPEAIMIKFPLSFSAKLKDLKTNVANRIKPTTTRNFSIGYKVENDICHSISKDDDLKGYIQKSISEEATFIEMLSDRDLEVCIQASISKEATFIAMVVKLDA